MGGPVPDHRRGALAAAEIRALSFAGEPPDPRGLGPALRLASAEGALVFPPGRIRGALARPKAAG